jgi:hypothetical protein
VLRGVGPGEAHHLVPAGAESVDVTASVCRSGRPMLWANGAEVFSRLGPGTLDIDRAAHDDVASSPESFVQALDALAAELSSPPEDHARHAR